MSAFTGELRLASLDAGCRVWRLEEPLQYEIGALGSGALIVVPAGFVTDGASIPRLLQGVLPAWGRWSRAAIIHDYLCREMAERSYFAVPKWGIARKRREADAIFHEALRVCEVPRPLALIRISARNPGLQAGEG